MPHTPDDAPPPSFRITLMKVMAVQVVTLIVLWWLQARFDV